MSIRLLRRFTNLRHRSSTFRALPPDGGQATTKFCEICGLIIYVIFIDWRIAAGASVEQPQSVTGIFDGISDSHEVVLLA